jgi:glutamate synthase (NADPH/NADH) small chain
LIYRTSSAHEEGGERLFAVNTERFVGNENGNVRALALHEVQMVDGRFSKIEGTEREIPADLVLLAMGFLSTDGAAKGGFLYSLGVEVDSRGRAVRDADWKSTADSVFIAGDAGRGQSLIVWAIAEGRAAAAAVDAYLSGSSGLPAPIRPDTVALAAR